MDEHHDGLTPLDVKLYAVLKVMKQHDLTVMEFFKGFMESENHGIRIRRGLFMANHGVVDCINAMLTHKVYGPDKRPTKHSREIMSEELGPLLTSLLGEIIQYKLDQYMQDPLAKKSPMFMKAEDAACFDFNA